MKMTKLSDLPGVGPAMVGHLQNKGINTIQQLLDSDDATLLAIRGISPTRVASFRNVGQMMLNMSQDATPDEASSEVDTTEAQAVVVDADITLPAGTSKAGAAKKKEKSSAAKKKAKAASKKKAKADEKKKADAEVKKAKAAAKKKAEAAKKKAKESAKKKATAAKKKEKAAAKKAEKKKTAGKKASKKKS
ncbi:helix-hairpin-helix domain-containing protein [Sulfitobacter undariae]|nr:helix-hairpin-helix domain-containing protein [Sulfitobacter undariae]